ncbi:MAG: TnpV protein [Oscillospiraceae bacterium]
MELTYTQHGDFRLPNFVAPQEEPCRYGKYGTLRKNYLKQHRRVLYINLLTSGKLTAHLNEMDDLTRKAVDDLVSAMAGLSGISEDLKARDPMEWCGQMNAIRHQAEEIAMKDYVFD